MCTIFILFTLHTNPKSWGQEINGRSYFSPSKSWVILSLLQRLEMGLAEKIWVQVSVSLRHPYIHSESRIWLRAKQATLPQNLNLYAKPSTKSRNMRARISSRPHAVQVPGCKMAHGTGAMVMRLYISQFRSGSCTASSEVQQMVGPSYLSIFVCFYFSIQFRNTTLPAEAMVGIAAKTWKQWSLSLLLTVSSSLVPSRMRWRDNESSVVFYIPMSPLWLPAWQLQRCCFNDKTVKENAQRG